MPLMCHCDRISNFPYVLWTFQPAVFSCNTKRKLMYRKYNEILLSARYASICMTDYYRCLWWRTNTHTNTNTLSQTQKTQIPIWKSIHSIRYNLWHGMAFWLYIFSSKTIRLSIYPVFFEMFIVWILLWIANWARILSKIS